MPYQLTIVEHPAYLHAIATGSHSAQNVLRFLAEAYEACVKRGHTSVLLEVNFKKTRMLQLLQSTMV